MVKRVFVVRRNCRVRSVTCVHKSFQTYGNDQKIQSSAACRAYFLCGFLFKPANYFSGFRSDYQLGPDVDTILGDKYYRVDTAA